MNEFRYFPKKINSRYTYLIYCGVIILALFIFHYLKRNHTNSWNPWALEIILGITGITYLCLKKLTTEVFFNFKNKTLDISYATIFKNKNKISISFENLDFELKKDQVRSSTNWILYVYDGEDVKYKLTTFPDRFTKENLENICNQDY